VAARAPADGLSSPVAMTTSVTEHARGVPVRVRGMAAPLAVELARSPRKHRRSPCGCSAGRGADPGPSANCGRQAAADRPPRAVRAGGGTAGRRRAAPGDRRPAEPRPPDRLDVAPRRALPRTRCAVARTAGTAGTAGDHDIAALVAELRARGDTGSSQSVRRLVARLVHTSEPAAVVTAETPRDGGPAGPKPPSPRQVSWLLFATEEEVESRHPGMVSNFFRHARLPVKQPE
jgi:hypothetical protein